MDGLRPIAVAGTHGKTTTTSMLAVSLTELGLDPSYAIGGDLDAPGSNALHGDGEIFVAEADESDRSFHKYAPEVAIVLNVELDHHANYASMDEIYESFETFVGPDRPRRHAGDLRRPGGRAGADPAAVGRPAGSVRSVTYGEAEDADVRVLTVVPQGLTSEVTVAPRTAQELTFTVSVPGRHYAHNAVAALAAGVGARRPRRTSWPPRSAAYTGVKRRLQLKGEAAGVQVIDSYAHHPTEMTADLEAMRGGRRRLPHPRPLPAAPLLPHPGAGQGDGPGPGPGRRLGRPRHLPGPRGPDPRCHQRADHRGGAGRGRGRDSGPRQGRRHRRWSREWRSRAISFSPWARAMSPTSAR